MSPFWYASRAAQTISFAFHERFQSISGIVPDVYHFWRSDKDLSAFPAGITRMFIESPLHSDHTGDLE